MKRPFIKLPVTIKLGPGERRLSAQIHDQGFPYDPVQVRQWQQSADAIQTLLRAKLMTAFGAKYAYKHLGKQIEDGLNQVISSV